MYKILGKWYVSGPMPDTQQTFDSLAAQFEVFTRDLRECQSREQRWLLLEGMSLLIGEIEQLLLHEQSAAESACAAPTTPPFARAAPSASGT